MSDLILKDEYFKIIGACMNVHRELGCGFLEAVYQEALGIEFEEQKIPFIKEKNIKISYKQIILHKEYYADFLCYDNIILEIKALSELRNEHEAQVINYLKASGKQLGILVNFGERSLKHKRLILT